LGVTVHAVVGRYQLTWDGLDLGLCSDQEKLFEIVLASLRCGTYLQVTHLGAEHCQENYDWTTFDVMLTQKLEAMDVTKHWAEREAKNIARWAQRLGRVPC